MRIAWVMDEVITCGGVKIPFGYCRELRKLGIQSDIYANGRNQELETYYGVKVKPMKFLRDFTDEDMIIAVWWRQVPELEQYKGRKVQFLQGHDLKAYAAGGPWEECLKIRQRENWEILAVSDYAANWIGREYKVVPNAIDEIFFKDFHVKKDLDALVEGNDEPNKNIDYAIERARLDGHAKIGWLGRTTHPIPGIIQIENPRQADLPRIYQRARHFYKYSKSEGFCLPIVEAKASGCEIHTWDQGHNFPEDFDPKDYSWDKTINKFLSLYAKT